MMKLFIKQLIANKMIGNLNLIVLFSSALFLLNGFKLTEQNVSISKKPIQIYEKNPYYWEYMGNPILLIGGSKEDNIFNFPEGLEEHLDVLRECGGNYIRNTMSSRKPGNLWAFKKLDNGLYDLNQWDEQYWNRFENFLKMCFVRDIIVQIEIWDPWDYYKSEAATGYGAENTGWESCPFNPEFNINYTAEESGLASQINYYSNKVPTAHSFFHSVPELKDLPVVRRYQERFVEKLLSVSLKYPHVLYCINNEIGEPLEWGQYWARYIRQKAEEKGQKIFLTDMRRDGNLMSDEQLKLMHDRDHFDFFEISQVNGNNHQRHSDMIMFVRDQLKENPLPLNNVKIYGGNIGSWTTSVEEGTRRFWRNIFAGCASARFHREGPSEHYFGIGLSELAQRHIRSMRMFSERIDIFSCQPSNYLLKNRESNEAYCLAESLKQFAVYFTDDGEVDIDLSHVTGKWELQWLDIIDSEWKEAGVIDSGAMVSLKTPEKGQWVAVLLPKR